jgi:hypothetical protein
MYAIVTNLIKEQKTIKEMAQHIVRYGLSEKEVIVIAKALADTASDPVVGTSRLSRLRKELRMLKASKAIISATLDPELIHLSNKIQKERSEQRENEGIDYPDHFSLESVKERLGEYDTTNKPNIQALADIMIMLCVRPAELRTLHIANGKITCYVNSRGQQDFP